MGLLSIFKRSRAASASPVESGGDAVQQARTRARRRLVGAAVLVGIGIIVFPLLFETQPRPIAVDLPIVIPPKDSVAPLALPASRPLAAAPAAAPVASVQAPNGEQPSAAVGGGPATAARPHAAAAAVPATASAPPAVAAAHKPPADPRADAERARALLEGQATVLAKRDESTGKAAAASAQASTAGGARLVVQVGAFADAAAVRLARQRVEKLGIKTYTQEVKTDAGKRTRVRVGPFASREEADRVAGRLKSAGLPAQVLTL